MQETKKALVLFHYTEKTKSNLIVAISMLEVLETLENSEIIGAEKLMVAYFNALIREVNIAANASGEPNFRKVGEKLEETVEQIKQHNYNNAIKLISEGISLTTSSGSQAAKVLKNKDLI